MNSNVVLLSPDESLLFVSNQGNGSPDSDHTVTVFTVASDGGLTLVPDSPFLATGGRGATGMATDSSGLFLYLAIAIQEDNGRLCGCAVYVFNVDSSGELNPVVGSPFSTGQGLASALLSLTAYPGKTCPTDATNRRGNSPRRLPGTKLRLGVSR